MAQHYKIADENIINSIKRIAPKVFKDSKRKLLMDWSYYGKDIMHLPKEYNPDGLAFTIKGYNIKALEDWKDEPYAEENATLEVHLDLNGNVTNVYYPL